MSEVTTGCVPRSSPISRLLVCRACICGAGHARKLGGTIGGGVRVNLSVGLPKEQGVDVINCRSGAPGKFDSIARCFACATGCCAVSGKLVLGPKRPALMS